MTQEKITEPTEKNKSKMIGRKFGRWTALEKKIKKGRVCFKCQCECGTIKTVDVGNLRSGLSQSCGCIKRERLTKHGMTGTPTYRSWQAMIQRCSNPRHKYYKHYGGHGINVCLRWLKFELFFIDVGKRPKGKTLDRINTEGNYEKNNVKWSNPTQQNINQRISKRNKTGAKGVRWDRNRQKYVVNIGINCISHFIGRFLTLEAAVTARQQAELKYWPEQNQLL